MKTSMGEVVKVLKSGALLLVLAAFLQGCAGGGGGGGNLTGQTGFGGYTGPYSSILASELLGLQEYKNIATYGPNSVEFDSTYANPLELTNTYQAHAYSLTGRGQTIAIFDTGFNSLNELSTTRTGFADIQGKWNANQVTFIGDTAESNNSNHGNAVASIAAASLDRIGYGYFASLNGEAPYPEFDGGAYPKLNHGIVGFAPQANLALVDLESITGSSGLANTLGSALQRSVKAFNFSVALSSGNALEPEALRSGTAQISASLPANRSSFTVSQAADYLGSVTSLLSSDWQQVLAGLNNAQSSGVVVTALQDRTAGPRASLFASLPEIYPALKEAWIAVGNINAIRIGNSWSYSTPNSVPCGQTASYCLVVDATEITGAGIRNASGYAVGKTGADYGAPQVSGMIALLAEAFPNHTPEQLTTRLLATATNIGASTSQRVFSGGISHGYNETYGHGIPNMLAALRPIESGTRLLSFVPEGDPTTAVGLPVKDSFIRTSGALGLSLKQSLAGLQVLSYDALGAPFLINLNDRIFTASTVSYSDFFFNSLARRGGLKFTTQADSYRRSNATMVSLGMFRSLYDAQADLLQFNPARTSASHLGLISQLPLRGYTHASTLSSVSFQLPQGTAITSYIKSKDPQTSQPHPVQQQPNVVGLSFHAKSDHDRTSFSMTMGVEIESNTFAGSRSNGALQTGQGGTSAYISPTLHQALGNFWTISAGVTSGITRVTGHSPQSSLIESLSPIVTSEAFLVASREGLFDSKGTFYLKAWQPEQIESGSVRIRIPSLAPPTQPVSHTITDVSLQSDHRPVYTSVGLRVQTSRNSEFIGELVKAPASGQALNETSQGLYMKYSRTF